jgi:hypothetical protein
MFSECAAHACIRCDWCRHTHPALWVGAQPQYSLPHAGARRRVSSRPIFWGTRSRIGWRWVCGEKVFSLQTLPARADESRKGVAQYAGFSLHAGIGVEADQCEKLERLTRYVSRPPVSVGAARSHGAGVGPLPTEDPVPRRDDPHRAGAVGLHRPADGARAAAPGPPRSDDIRMNWARRLNRVFGIEIEQCVRCGGGNGPRAVSRSRLTRRAASAVILLDTSALLLLDIGHRRSLALKKWGGRLHVSPAHFPIVDSRSF